MTFKEDIAAMQLRIAKEKYREAYSMVEALELQLDLLQQADRLGARP